MASQKLTQLIPAADQMIEKLKKYLKSALEKPAPICAMILDPRIKLRHLEKNQSFLRDHQISSLTVDDALRSFKFEARSFDHSPSRMQPTSTSKIKPKKTTTNLSTIEANIFGDSTVANDLSAEIEQYITEANEKPSINILNYWSQHRKIYPSLSLMAKSYLGIPATSAPSERVFSLSKTIIGSQRHSLSSQSIQQLVCVKDWYQKYEEMVDISSTTLPNSLTYSDDETDGE